MNGVNLLTTLAIALTASAAYADVYDHFNSGLAGLPARVFEGPEPASFVNLHAIAMVAPEQKVSPAVAARGSLAADAPVFKALLSAPAPLFSAQTGIEPYQLHFLAVQGQGPAQAVVWGMKQGVQAKLVAHLGKAGFTPVEGGEQALQNGVLGMPNLSAANATNPWLWSTGAASVVKATPALFYQAQSVEALQAALQQPSALVAEAGATLSESYGAGPDLVTQALFFSAAFGMHAGGTAPDGLPPYLGGMLADLHGMEGEKTLLTLVYSDCPQADKAKAALEAHWPLDKPGGVVFSTVETTHDCLATATVTNTVTNANTVTHSHPDTNTHTHTHTTSEPSRNPSFDALYAAMLQRNFVPVLGRSSPP